VRLGVACVQCLECIRHAQVQPLPPRGGQEGEQGLADLLVDEGVTRFAVGGDVRDQRGAHRFLERVEQLVLIHTLEASEHVEAEALAR
jgi:hypothetical protein